MKILIVKSSLAAVACLGFSINANAQALTCGDLIWNEGVGEGFAAACSEVVERNGEWYAKASAQIVAQRPAGTYYRYVLPDGSLSEVDLVAPENEDFVANIDGQPVMVKDLQVRQKVNLYLGDTFWSLPEPEPVAMAAPEPEPVAEPEPMAEPEPAPVMLPTTAGQFGWLAVIGGLFLLLGGALRFARK
jgi:hypothetical protein